MCVFILVSDDFQFLTWITPSPAPGFTFGLETCVIFTTDIFLSPASEREVPHHRSGWGGGTQPGLDWGGGLPWTGLDGGGVLWPGLDGGRGTPARTGWWVVPQLGLDGGVVPQPCLDGGVGEGGTQGTPTRSGWWGGTPIRQSSIASTCYPADSMPLAFTQEDFLVLHKITRCNRLTMFTGINIIDPDCLTRGRFAGINIQNCEIP